MNGRNWTQFLHVWQTMAEAFSNCIVWHDYIMVLHRHPVVFEKLFSRIEKSTCTSKTRGAQIRDARTPLHTHREYNFNDEAHQSIVSGLRCRCLRGLVVDFWIFFCVHAKTWQRRAQHIYFHLHFILINFVIASVSMSASDFGYFRWPTSNGNKTARSISIEFRYAWILNIRARMAPTIHRHIV